MIFRRDRYGNILYLLLHYPSGHWDLVKGKMEEGEEIYDTVVRETEEETGITDLRFIDTFQREIRYDFGYNGKTVHKRVTVLLAESATRRITISDEHTEYVWLEFARATRKTTYENARRVIVDANDLILRGPWEYRGIEGSG